NTFNTLNLLPGRPAAAPACHDTAAKKHVDGQADGDNANACGCGASQRIGWIQGMTYPAGRERARSVLHGTRTVLFGARGNGNPSMSAPAMAGLWEAKSTEALRKKVFYEIAVFILGCGNPVILLLLWPGWLVVGGLVYVLWQYSV
ncbi:hypothetical protein E4U43_006459, partial [Claviceps pusilla]